MKRNFKKTLAAFFAATVMAVSTCGISASAVNLSASWKTYHTKTTAPTYTGQADYAEIAYSTEGSTCYQNSVSTTANGGTGYVAVTCTNGTMDTVKLYRSTISKICKPVQTGIIISSNYKFYAYSTTSGATYTCSGNIVTNE